MTKMASNGQMSPNDWSTWWQRRKAQGSLVAERRFRGKDGRTFPIELPASHRENEGEESTCVFSRDFRVYPDTYAWEINHERKVGR